MAAPDIYGLSIRDRNVIEKVIRQVLGNFPNQWHAPITDRELGHSPDLYVARLQSDEMLPAFDGTIPGRFDCDIYKIDLDDDFNPTGLTVFTDGATSPNNVKRTVYNIYRLPIIGVASPEHYYFPVYRDKTGRWLCFEPHELLAKNLSGDPIPSNDNGTVTIFKGPRGAEVTTDVTIDVWNKSPSAWEENAWGSVFLLSGLVYGAPFGGGTGGASRFIRFTTTTTFATGSSTSATVNDFWGGADPGASVTVWDETGSLDGQIAGLEGIATFDEIDSKWKVTHPHHWPRTDETPTTIGAASEGSEAADSSSHSGGGAVEIWFQSRTGYFQAGDKKLYAYMRKITFDSKGHYRGVSGETRVEVFATEIGVCET